MILETCVHCGKVLHREIHDGHTFLIDDATGGDVCGSWGTFGNEPHVSNHPYPTTNQKDTP